MRVLIHIHLYKSRFIKTFFISASAISNIFMAAGNDVLCIMENDKHIPIAPFAVLHCSHLLPSSKNTQKNCSENLVYIINLFTFAAKEIDIARVCSFIFHFMVYNINRFINHKTTSS